MFGRFPIETFARGPDKLDVVEVRPPGKEVVVVVHRRGFVG